MDGSTQVDLYLVKAIMSNLLPSSSYVSGSAPSYHPTQQAEVQPWNRGKLIPKASLAPIEAKGLLQDIERMEAVVDKAFEELEADCDEVLFGHAEESRFTHYAEVLERTRRALFAEAAHLQGPLGIYNKLARVKELTELPLLIERVQSVGVSLILALTTALDLDAICGEKYSQELAFFTQRLAKLFGQETVSSLSEIRHCCEQFAFELERKGEDPTRNILEQHKLDMRKALYALSIKLALNLIEGRDRELDSSFSVTLKGYLAQFSEEQGKEVEPLQEDEFDPKDMKLRKWYAFLRNKAREGTPSQKAKEISKRLETYVGKGLSGLLKSEKDMAKTLAGPKREKLDLQLNARCIARLKVFLLTECKKLKEVPDDPLIPRIMHYAFGLFAAIGNAEEHLDLACSFTSEKADAHFRFLKTFSDYISNQDDAITEREKAEKVYMLLLEFGRASPELTEREKVKATYKYVESIINSESRDESYFGQAEKFLWYSQDYAREILAVKVPELLLRTPEEMVVTTELLQGRLQYSAKEVRDALPNHVVSSLLKRIIEVLFLRTETPQDMTTSLELYQIRKLFSKQFATTCEWYPTAKRIFDAYADVIQDENMLEHALEVGALASRSEDVLSYVQAWHHYFSFQKRHGEERTLLRWLEEARERYNYPKVTDPVINRDISTWGSFHADVDGHFIRLIGACLYGNGYEEIDAQKLLLAVLTERVYQLGPFTEKLVFENALKKLCVSSKVRLSEIEQELVSTSQEDSVRLQLARSRLNPQTGLDPFYKRDIEAICNPQAGDGDV